MLALVKRRGEIQSSLAIEGFQNSVRNFQSHSSNAGILDFVLHYLSGALDLSSFVKVVKESELNLQATAAAAMIDVLWLLGSQVRRACTRSGNTLITCCAIIAACGRRRDN
jgi:hypothetical protein